MCYITFSWSVLAPGSNRSSPKKAVFNENLHFLWHWNKAKVSLISNESYSVSACAVYRTSSNSMKSKQTRKSHGDSFLFFADVFLLFCYFFFCVFFLTLHFVKHKEKNILSVTDIANYWTFKISGDLADATELTWNFTSLATHTNIGEWALTILIQFQFFLCVDQQFIN